MHCDCVLWLCTVTVYCHYVLWLYCAVTVYCDCTVTVLAVNWPPGPVVFLLVTDHIVAMVSIPEGTVLQQTTPHYTTLHHTLPNCTSPHCTTLHHTTQHCTTLHKTALHRTAPHYTAPSPVCQQLGKERAEEEPQEQHAGRWQLTANRCYWHSLLTAGIIWKTTSNSWYCLTNDC